MFDRAKPWVGLSGARRVLVKVLTLMVIVSGLGFVLLGALVTLAAALPAAGYGSLTSLALDPVSAFALQYFALFLLFAIIALIVSLVAWKGAKMSHRVGFAVITTFLFGMVLLGALNLAPAPVTGGAQTTTALNMVITPSVDTTASYPAGSFTACTSQNLLSSNGAKTAAGVVWSAISSGLGAQYNAQGPTSGQFIMQTGDQTIVSQGGGKMSAQCYQMKFVFAYTNAPPASGGGSVYFPVFVYLTSVSYSAPASNLNSAPFNQQYNNGTAVNVPIFAQATVGLTAFPVLVKDQAGTWQQVCPNLQNQNLQFASSLPTCAGMNVNQNPTTNAVTFTIDVIVNGGIFGWATSDAGTGSSLNLGFQIGLPQGQALPGYQGYYTPTLASYTLSLQRTAA